MDIELVGREALARSDRFLRTLGVVGAVLLGGVVALSGTSWPSWLGALTITIGCAALALMVKTRNVRLYILVAIVCVASALVWPSALAPSLLAAMVLLAVMAVLLPIPWLVGLVTLVPAAKIFIVPGIGVQARLDGMLSVMVMGGMCVAFSIRSGAAAEALQERSSAGGELDRVHALLNEVTLQDAVTGLPNRKALVDRLEAVMKPPGVPGAIALIDLDHFATIDETFGYEVGDDVLRHGSQQLVEDGGASVFRIGDDEFAVILTDIADAHAAGVAAQHLQDVLAKPLPVEPHLSAAASLGLALFPRHGRIAHEVLGHANGALRHAKSSGRNCYRLYYDDLGDRSSRQLDLHASLQQALFTPQIFMYYQPQVHMKTRQVVGAEALLRWMHPSAGFISPGEFVPLAEAFGLMLSLGDWVLETACREVLPLLDKAPGMKRSVSLSATQLAPADAVERLDGIMKRVGFPPERLVLEVTESLTMSTVPRVVEKLQSLRNRGYSLSIDDFGTRYASLAYLDSFPVDEIKIDQTFVRNIGNRPAIVSAVMTLARHMGLHVVAEGVETSQQAWYLQSLGCELAQGFHYARPMPLNKFQAWVDAASSVSNR